MIEWFVATNLLTWIVATAVFYASAVASDWLRDIPPLQWGIAQVILPLLALLCAIATAVSAFAAIARTAIIIARLF